MKKILMIEDWEKFKKELQRYATSINFRGESEPVVGLVLNLFFETILEVLKYHELDVSGFEAEVKLRSEPYIKPSGWSGSQPILYIELPMKEKTVWTIKDKLQVLVVKPKNQKKAEAVK